MTKPLNVVYSSDENYAVHMGISILSLLENNKDIAQIYVYVLDNNISEQNKNNLKTVCESYGRELFFVDYSQLEKELKTKLKADRSLSTYARIFMTSLLPNNIDELLYLDCDTIICGSLAPLLNIEWNDKLIAGVRDTYNEEKKNKLAMQSSDVYINAGVVYTNFKYWISENIEKDFGIIIDRYNGNVPGFDQGVINMAINKKIMLPPQFNLMTQMVTMNYKTMIDYYKMNTYYSEKEIENAVKNPVIIHYTPCLSRRPWVKGCSHPLKDKYLYYKSISPWKDVPLINDTTNIKLKFVSILFNKLPYTSYKKIMRLLKSPKHKNR